MLIFRLNLYLRLKRIKDYFILDIPLGFVNRVEKFGGARTPGDNYGIKVYCRDVRNLK